MRRSITLKAILLLIVMTVAGVATVHTASAATGQVYVSPGTVSVQNGANFSVGLRINPGSSVDSVTLGLSWDNSKVKYLSIDTSQSAFGQTLTQSVSSNSLSTDRGNLSNPVGGDSLIATVNFQALAGSGSSALTLSNVNAYLVGVATNPSAGNGTVNFTTPAPPPPASGGGGSSSGSSGGSSGGTKPPTGTSGGSSSSNNGGAAPAAGDTTPPKVETVQTPDGKVQFKAAHVTLTTSEPTQVYIKYGMGEQLNLQTPLSELSKTHDINLNSVDLLPGTSYSYQVIAKDASGNETQSPVKTFKTKGYSVRVTVLGSDNKPLRKAQVVLHSDPMTAKTDGNGVVQFDNVAPGSHHVTYTSKGKEYSQAIAVDDTVVTNAASGAQSAAVQNVAVQFAVKGNGAFPVLLPVTLLVLLVAVLGGFLFRSKLNPRMRMQPLGVMVNQPSVSASYDQGTSNPNEHDHAPIEHAHGIHTPNPGTVVEPHDDNKRIV